MPRRDQPDTKELIQQAALELFIKYGFSATSLQQIADQVGVTKAALYYHFPSKADLARSLFEPWITDTEAFLDEVEHAGSAEPGYVFEASFDIIVNHRLAFMAMMSDASILQHVDLVTWMTNLLERYRVLLAGSDATLAQRVRASVALGGLNDAAALFASEPIEEVRAASVDAALAALRGESASEDGAAS